MISLPALKEDGKQLTGIKNNNNDRMNSGNHQIYDYFSIKISKTTKEILFNTEKDERYLYFLHYGFLRTRKTYHERCTNVDSRHRFTHTCDEFHRLLLCHMPVHAVQHVVGYVL